MLGSLSPITQHDDDSPNSTLRQHDATIRQHNDPPHFPISQHVPPHPTIREHDATIWRDGSLGFGRAVGGDTDTSTSMGMGHGPLKLGRVIGGVTDTSYLHRNGDGSGVLQGSGRSYKHFYLHRSGVWVSGLLQGNGRSYKHVYFYRNMRWVF